MTAVASAVTIPARERAVQARALPTRTIRVALAGCGVVGGALVRLLHSSADAIGARHGVRVEIVRVLVRDARRKRDVPLRAGVFTSDVEQFVAEDVDVVVEAIGGSDVAGVIARAALGRGTRLITANKELVASAGASLAALGRTAGATLDFGAAVGGSVPVISTLRDLLGTLPPVYVRGILNGTSNYVLSQLERGSDYPEALAAACHRGLAEADCTRDMDGSDTAAKLAIVAWVSFGVDPSTLPVRRIGLLPEPARFVRYASALGGRVRLIAECARVTDGGITCVVEPVIVPLESSFARTELEDNRVEVGLGWSGPLAVSGPGAGGAPTATSLLSDLLSPVPRTADSSPTRAFEAVDDPRAHSWLVAGRVSARTLLRTLDTSGIPIQSVRASAGDSHVVTRPAAWAALQPVIAELAASNADPLVARVELPAVGRDLS
ncbi:MAG: homoserine dehydrogenase [Gemmatimonadaceae bacterium]|nr:homoserine dehydrogenase [Gemmatimonadaceae bacterium]